MRINLRVEFANGSTEEITCTASDLVKFEERFNLSVTRLEQEMRLTHLLFLAHSSLARQGKVKDDFDTWVESVATVGASEIDPK